jgi:prepilin-type N-terminal cleavage/methylation domain-containing protein
MLRRRGFTLIELLVAAALMLFILVILTEAFGTALRAFRDLKAVGDMEGRLQAASAILRRDLSADHFDGRKRLSELSARLDDVPREGFFRILAPVVPPNEGQDSDGLNSRRVTNHLLHFSIKLRGNGRDTFFPATVTQDRLLRTGRTTFFDHAPDTRYQEPNAPDVYPGQWAEAAYFLGRLPDYQTPDGTPLYALLRSQLVVVANNLDNANLVFNVDPLDPTMLARYAEMSCQPDARLNRLYFNTPRDLVKRTYQYPDPPPNDLLVSRRAFDPANPTLRAASVLLTDVVSFEVQALRGREFADLPQFDTGVVGTSSTTPPEPISALKITLRVWDAKTRATRQATIIQDM